MRVIGITGGIGTGKSYIMQIFAQSGFPTYSADQRAKQLMEEDEIVRQKLRELLGKEAYLPDGRLNRSHVAKHIFQNPELRLQINQIVHPHTIADFQRWVHAHALEGHKAVFKEAALTLEAGGYFSVDILMVVYAPLKVRIQRLQQRDGLSEEEILNRIRSQWPEWKKIAHADFVLINDGVLPVEPQLRAFCEKYDLPVPPIFAR
ncbi:MAG: dephospho-CoA kinase [Bacteroidia bacterium]|nr:dephospho-CoA kinase [Bacteroidia bacterium]MCX7764124.1 dephospho-CoA kinase [Bacteroidia bacterium]MDW8057551.1 dephospho-CoA kinase [Bacteroidia bacterium]